MPDKKLTDSEIVKEFQLRTLKAEHPGFILCGQIVDLINRLQAKVIKEQNKNSKLRNERNRLQAKVERLKDLCADCSMLKGKIETISDLQKQIEYWQRGYNDLRQELKTAKAEAIKEFAERLKKQSILCAGCVPWYDIQETIDNLLKELVGDNQ